MEAELDGGLTEAEQAYFDSEGESHFEPEKQADDPPSQDEQAEGKPGDEDAQAEIEGRDKDDKGRFVNYGALHKERVRRQELEKEVSELQQFKASMAEKMKWTEALLKPQEEKPVDDDPEPDPLVDIFAHNAWLKRQFEKERNSREQERQQTEERTKAAEAEKQVWDLWDSSVEQYKAENADFPNAATWLADYRDKQLTALAKADPRFSTKQARDAQMNAELRDIVVSAAQQKMSPAQLIYEIAQGYGYAPKPADPAAIQMPDKLKAVDAAQQASRTIAASPGSRAGADEITIESLAAMPQAEFNEWMKVPANAKRFEKMMGG